MAQPTFTSKRLIEAFKTLDLNSDGVLTELEIDSAVIDLSLPRQLAEVVAVLKAEFNDIKKLRKGRHKITGLTIVDILEFSQVLLTQSEQVDFEKTLRENEFQSAREVEKDPFLLVKIARGLVSQISSMAAGELTLYGSQRYPRQGVSVQAIRQGRIGNCYFLAALGSVVVAQPQLVGRMIADNRNNTYTVTFPGARFEPVTVDRPTMVELALYTHATELGIWPAVIEKAFGVYNRTIVLTPHIVPAENTHSTDAWINPFKLLTGQNEKVELLSNSSPEKLASILTKAFKEKRGVTADSKLACTSIPGQHAFSVINWDPQDSRITLRNPWGPVPGSEPMVASGEPVDGVLDGVFTLDLDHFFDCFRVVRYEEWTSLSEYEQSDSSLAAPVKQHENFKSPSELESWDRFAPTILGRIATGIVIMLTGAIFTALPVSCLAMTLASTHWPVTSGIIEDAGVSFEPIRANRTFSDLGILYSYNVGGHNYRSNFVGGMADYFTQPADLLIKEKYPVGTHVQVHYNPDSPTESCLLTGFQLFKIAFFLLWIVLALLIFSTGVGFIRDREFFTSMVELRIKRKKNELKNIDPFA